MGGTHSAKKQEEFLLLFHHSLWISSNHASASRPYSSMEKVSPLRLPSISAFSRITGIVSAGMPPAFMALVNTLRLWPKPIFTRRKKSFLSFTATAGSFLRRSFRTVDVTWGLGMKAVGGMSSTRSEVQSKFTARVRAP